MTDQHGALGQDVVHGELVLALAVLQDLPAALVLARAGVERDVGAVGQLLVHVVLHAVEDPLRIGKVLLGKGLPFLLELEHLGLVLVACAQRVPLGSDRIQVQEGRDLAQGIVGRRAKACPEALLGHARLRRLELRVQGPLHV